MNPDPLANRLAVLLVDFQRRYRSQRGWGALVFPAVPADQIDEFAADLAPILRQVVLEVVRDIYPPVGR